MTTEFVGVPDDLSAARVLEHLREVARTKETIYAVYVIDPGTRRLEARGVAPRAASGRPGVRRP